MYHPFIADVHLDLSMNAMEWNRDLRLTVAEIRQMESGMRDKPDRGKGTVSFPALRGGNIGLCVATLIARYVKRSNPLPGWHSPAQAWAQTQGQLAWYEEMIRQGHLQQICDTSALDAHLKAWAEDAETTPIGFVLSLEGADSLVSLDHLRLMQEKGLRAVGPAHYGPGTYAFGTDSEGAIGHKGRELLSVMEELNLILDVTHLCDLSFWEAIDHFRGPLWASHSNCRTLVDHNRQFSDEQIKTIIERGGVIGIPLDAWMMVPGWQRGISTPEAMGVSLNTMIDQMDHICQLAGNADHVGIGTDLDGGFGKEQCPYDLETIADLQKLPALLTGRGYSQSDIEKILSGNFLHFMRRAWG
ncbi:MAG: membrane dipeptidase [Bacteroidia bacterium]|nr:membrane dipeptidase [Bacteroidia bacterium]